MNAIIIKISNDINIFKIEKYASILNIKNLIYHLFKNLKTIKYEILNSLTNKIEIKFV